MIKETNMEHFRGEIEKIYEDNGGFALKNNKIVPCGNLTCLECSFNYGSCTKATVLWLMSEYKPEPVLTAREKHFVEAINNGFIARDKNNNLCWYSVKPLRRIDVPIWKNNRRSFSISISRTEIFANDMFPFITWEDEEPWSVEDLRKLKVQE